MPPILIYRVGQTPGQEKAVFSGRLGVQTPETFPSEYFAEEGVVKPKLTLCPANSLDVHLGTVLPGLNAHKIGPIPITNFLFEAFNAESMKIDKEWNCFGRNIARANADVRLENLFSIDRNETPPTYLVANRDTTQILRTLIIITAIYRINSISNDLYRDRVKDSAGRLLASIDGGEFDFHAAETKFLSWNSYPHFRRVIAGIDMFLHRFPTHKYALCRFGTIVSRLKDCAILPELDYITRAMSLEMPIFATWIWSPTIANQFDRVLKDGEEIDDPYSYSMYITELGLSLKSPWSATMNPDLHFFIHILGASRREQRSINARIVGTVDKVQALHTAMICAYVFSETITADVQYHVNKGYVVVEEQDENPDEEEEADTIEFPQTTDANEWLGFFKEKKCVVPLKIRQNLATIWAKFENTRDGSVGRFLYEEGSRILQLYPLRNQNN